MEGRANLLLIAKAVFATKVGALNAVSLLRRSKPDDVECGDWKFGSILRHEEAPQLGTSLDGKRGNLLSVSLYICMKSEQIHLLHINRSESALRYMVIM